MVGMSIAGGFCLRAIALKCRRRHAGFKATTFLPMPAREAPGWMMPNCRNHLPVDNTVETSTQRLLNTFYMRCSESRRSGTRTHMRSDQSRHSVSNDSHVTSTAEIQLFVGFLVRLSIFA